MSCCSEQKPKDEKKESGCCGGKEEKKPTEEKKDSCCGGKECGCGK